MRLFTARSMIDGTGRNAIEDGALLVDEGEITATGTVHDLNAADAEVIDLGDVTLIPGLIDTHVHLSSLTWDRTEFDFEAESDEIHLLICANNARIALEEGITTLRDCGARNDVIFTFKDAVNRGLVPSPRLLAAGGPITRTGGYGDILGGVEVDTKEEMRKAIRAQVKRGADFIKIMATNGILLKPPGSQPGLLYYDDDTLRVAVQEAKELGRNVAAHCLGTYGIEAVVRAGVDSIEHCAFYDYHGERSEYEPELGEAIAAQGIYVNATHSFCYGASLRVGSETRDPFIKEVGLHMKDLIEGLSTVRARTIENAKKLIAAGVQIIPGSDAASFLQPFGEYALMAQQMEEALGMEPTQVLEACTKHAAAAIGRSEELGTLEVGKRADITAVDGDPTKDISALGRVQATVVDGEILYRKSD